MTEFIAHEVEVATIDGGAGDEANELVKRDSAVNGIVVVAHHHVPVHLAVDKAENECLVAHKSLVVTLGIADCLLVGTAVGKLPEYRCRVPILIFLLLDCLNPIVGDSHRHAIVESYSTVFHRDSESGHTAHFLGNGDCIGVHGVNHLIGKAQIGDCVGVLTAVIVVVIAAECLSQSVAIIEHRGDTVEAEAVEAIFLKPELAVAEQEVKHLVLSVVEAKRVPCRVLAAMVAIEVLVVAAIEAAKSLKLIFHGVRVHNVHNHGNSHAVGIVDEVLQVVGCAEAARCSIEARYVIAKRAVVGVLLDSHNLNGIISVGCHARQHIGAELVVASHSLLISCHTYVALIDEQWRCIWLEVFYLEFVGSCGIPHLSREDVGLFVLHHAGGIGRHTLAFSTIPVHAQLVEVAMVQSLRLHYQLPGTVVDARHAEVLSFFPIVEVAHHIDFSGIRCPLTQHPALAGLVQAEKLVGVGEVGDSASIGSQLFLFANHVLMAAIDCIGIRLQPGVIFNYGEYSFHVFGI